MKETGFAVGRTGAGLAAGRGVPDGEEGDGDDGDGVPDGAVPPP